MKLIASNSFPNSPIEIRENLMNLSDIELFRFRYCYELGSAFTAVSLLEDSIVNTMLVCDKIRIKHALGDDLAGWNDLLSKQRILQDSTLGSLVAILARHQIEERDLAYLRWLKEKRDFFIHRFFHIGCWPGDMDQVRLESLCRTLRYLQVIYFRGSQRIVSIFLRAGLLKELHRDKSGVLVSNSELEWN